MAGCYCWSVKDGSSIEMEVFESEAFLIFSLPIFLIVVGLFTLFWRKRGCFTPCGYVRKQDEISKLCLGVLDEIFFKARGFFSKFVENIDCETFGVDAMKSDDLFRPRIVLSFSMLASFLWHNLAIGLSVCVAWSASIGCLWNTYCAPDSEFSTAALASSALDNLSSMSSAKKSSDLCLYINASYSYFMSTRSLLSSSIYLFSSLFSALISARIFSCSHFKFWIWKVVERI